MAGIIIATNSRLEEPVVMASQESKGFEEAIRSLKDSSENALAEIKNLVSALNLKFDKIVDKVTLPSPEATVIVLPVANSRNNQSQTRFANMDFSKFIESNVVDQLAHLKQQGTVKEYEREFKKLADKIDGFPENKLIGCFVMGLKDEITIGVQMFRPNTLDQAIGLAKLKEMSLEALEKRSKNSKNLVSSGEKERKSAETTCAPTVLSIVKESEPLVGIDNSEGADGLKSWGDLKRQILENCSSEDVVKDSRIKVEDMYRVELEFSNKETKDEFPLLDNLELSVKEMYLEESEFRNDDTEGELQCGFERATNVESHDSTGNKECLEKMLVMKNHSISINHHSTLRGHYSDQKFVGGETPEQYRMIKILEQCLCQKKAQFSDMVICIFRTCDDRTIKIWDPGKSFIIIVCISAALASIWEQVSGTQYWGLQKHGFDIDPNVGRGLIYMYGQLKSTDFACKVLEKITDAHLVAQMVTALSKFADVSFVRVVFDKMPKKDPTARNGMKEGYTQLPQLSATRYSFYLQIMKHIEGHSMTCGFHKMSVLTLYDAASLYCSVLSRSFGDSETYLANNKHPGRVCGVSENNILKSFFKYKEEDGNVAKIKFVEPQVSSTFQQRTATCFAYGQSRSGHLYTMKPLAFEALQDVLRLLQLTYQNQCSQLVFNFLEKNGSS